jgi:hypothetical protein
LISANFDRCASCSSYLCGSLFEKNFGDESGDVAPAERRRSYDIDWERHVDDVTEEVLLERTPAMALDFIYHLVSWTLTTTFLSLDLLIFIYFLITLLLSDIASDYCS